MARRKFLCSSVDGEPWPDRLAAILTARRAAHALSDRRHRGMAAGRGSFSPWTCADIGGGTEGRCREGVRECWLRSCKAANAGKPLPLRNQRQEGVTRVRLQEGCPRDWRDRRDRKGGGAPSCTRRTPGRSGGTRCRQGRSG